MHSVSVMEMLKQQYTFCMKVGTGRNLDLSREYFKKLFRPLFYSWWNCPLSTFIYLSHNAAVGNSKERERNSNEDERSFFDLTYP